MNPDVVSTRRPEADRQPTRPVTVVTGGSEGIGLAIAGRFAARGQALLLVARRQAPLESAAADLRQRHGVQVATLAIDLTGPDALAGLERKLAELGAHVDMLVNSAGIGHCGDFAEIDAEHLDRLITLNVAVPGRLMRHVMAGMRQRGHGGILNVASLGGYAPGPYQAAYYASKAYLIALSEAVAAEARACGIRVTVVAPGPVSTAFHAKMNAEAALYRRLLPAMSPEGVAAWAVRGFDLGVRVVVPGFLSLILFAALRLTPHRILIPLMAALLHPGNRSGRGAAEDA